MSFPNNQNDFMAKKAMTLWMGDLDDGLEEAAISASFLAAGEQVVSVKCIKNRFDGKPAGYAFVEFPSIEASQRALLRLNGKAMPNTNPPKRFKLNTASKNKSQDGEEFSIFVGDLADEIDDFMLYETFQKRYPSCRGAKVVLGTGGVSRGFGFVRFGSQAEQMAALREMQNFDGLGNRPIRVSGATPRNRVDNRNNWNDHDNHQGDDGSGGDWGGSGGSGGQDTQWQQWQQMYQQQQQYWQYQQYSNQWGDYWQQNYQGDQSGAPTIGPEQSTGAAPSAPAAPAPPASKASKSDDPTEAFDVEGANAELMARNEDFIKSFEDSQWFSDILNFPCAAAN